MRTIVIEIPEPGDDRYQRCGFDVVDSEGRRANGLSFDEMLGQVVSMSHPRLIDGEPQYRMETAEDWAAYRERRAKARAEDVTDIPF